MPFSAALFFSQQAAPCQECLYIERLRTVELCFKSYTQREISELTGQSTNKVNRIIQAYRNEGRICDAPHDRRPRVTSAIEDKVLVAVAYANSFGTAQHHAQLAGVSASLTTVKRKLAEAGLRSRVAVQKPLLSDDNKAARLRFASEHSIWSVDDRKQAVFSDESTFTTRWDQKRRVLASCEHSLRARIHTRSGLKRKDLRKRVGRHVQRRTWRTALELKAP
ncbi:hypothetical protein HPB48_018531 [Haemaphysalis longicornis]|uniref:Transposase Tc1-like domain-containing protein n=1 Tax=Haemaphysalis longicornis TaxID=44386 RepID=A0A9J6FSK8_HAELO|nr:hypothetical protein HPB48_018531 [Haemaphysalis longicornis]